MAYYLLGSRYNGNVDILPNMIEAGVICIGFLPDIDLTNVIHDQEGLENLFDEEGNAHARAPLNHFLNIRPGDLIAIKRYHHLEGQNPILNIGAYAIVLGENEPIYEHQEALFHTLRVEFLDINLNHIVHFNLAHTIHALQPQYIEGIFADYAENQELDDNLNLRWQNIEPAVVTNRQGYIQTREHNRIQNRLIKAVTEEHGGENVRVEFENIDVMVELEDTIIIYEVKSSLSVKTCLREALGQILNYGWEQGLKEDNINKEIQYRIVGSEQPTEEDQKFINFLKETMNPLDFEYMSI